MHFKWNGGSWSYFILPPHCSRKCQILRLYDGRFACPSCDGFGQEKACPAGSTNCAPTPRQTQPPQGEARFEISPLRRGADRRTPGETQGMAAETVNIAGVDRALIVEALIKAEGSTIKAAKALKVRTGDLRRLCRTEPLVIEAALEATELALDKAEARIFRSLRKGQLSTRLQAASFILKRGRKAR